jgi:hypothetical protein
MAACVAIHHAPGGHYENTVMLPRCYCCGKEIGDTLALVAMSADPDRAFLFLPEHAHRADASHIIAMRVIERPKKG